MHKLMHYQTVVGSDPRISPESSESFIDQINQKCIEGYVFTGWSAFWDKHADEIRLIGLVEKSTFDDSKSRPFCQYGLAFGYPEQENELDLLFADEINRLALEGWSLIGWTPVWDRRSDRATVVGLVRTISEP